AYLLADEESLYRSQVEGRSYSPAHQGFYVRAVLGGRTVAQVFPVFPTVVPLRPEDSLASVIDRFDQSAHLVLPVVNRDGGLLGVVHLHELYWTANRRETLPWLVAVDLMRSKIKPLTPETSLQRAVELFAENDLSELPVVSAEGGKKLLG